MEKAPKKQILQIIDGTIPTERIYVQSFQNKKKVFTNQHQLIVERVESSYEPELRIKNYFAKVEEEDIIVKVTDIRIEHMVIKLIDRLWSKDKQACSIQLMEVKKVKGKGKHTERKSIQQNKSLSVCIVEQIEQSESGIQGRRRIRNSD